jgi:hypothetical protein
VNDVNAVFGKTGLWLIQKQNGLPAVLRGSRFYENLYKSPLRLVFMSESRTAYRYRVLKAGAIECGGAISCVVKNISASGASLEVVSALDIPDRLNLSIPAEHFNRPCHVVWRKEKRVGVVFD